MQRLIKVIDKDMAQKLESCGFKYMTEYTNDQEIYVFIESDDLMKTLNDKKNYSKKHWFINNALRF